MDEMALSPSWNAIRSIFAFIRKDFGEKSECPMNKSGALEANTGVRAR
jgi:hypothetical protein